MSNCILSVDHLFNCSNVSQYKNKFGLPNEIRTYLSHKIHSENFFYLLQDINFYHQL